MAEEVSFPRHKPGGGRAGKRDPPRSPRRADDPSHGAVTREVLDAARYITDMTAQLEAAAFAAHLDQLAYFLGMAKAESEILVRIGVLEAERAVDEPHAAHVSLAARAPGDLVAQISDAPGQFEFEQRYPNCVPKPPPPPARSSSVIGKSRAQ